LRGQVGARSGDTFIVQHACYGVQGHTIVNRLIDAPYYRGHLFIDGVSFLVLANPDVSVGRNRPRLDSSLGHLGAHVTVEAVTDGNALLLGFPAQDT
jgi:hypothetical protein